MLRLIVISLFCNTIERDGGDNNSGKGKSGDAAAFLCCMTFIG